MLVWRIRQLSRDTTGKEILDVNDSRREVTVKARQIYLRVDDFIKKILPGIEKTVTKQVACIRIHDTLARELGYQLAEVDESRPWGAFYRVVDEQADRFLKEFFPGLDPTEARLGQPDMVLSPKILLVSPGQRLSWQYHDRRSERWRFMNSGGYVKSLVDAPGELQAAKPGQIVQFATGERHRLCAADGAYTVVAEIWQHADPDNPSNEADIIRLEDDYSRN